MQRIARYVCMSQVWRRASMLATIRKLHLLRFRYTDEYRRKHPSIKDHSYYNFIAQGLLQIDGHNTAPYLIRAVQELTEQKYFALKIKITNGKPPARPTWDPFSFSSLCLLLLLCQCL
jgi:hypothetical protein